MTIEEIERKQRHLKYKQKVLVQTAEQFKERMSKNPTPSEIHLTNLLVSRGIEFEDQKIIYTLGKFWIADFYLPQFNLILELDGNQHYTQAGILKDADRDFKLQELGYRYCIRIPNSEALELTEDKLVNLLKQWGFLLSDDNSLSSPKLSKSPDEY